ncbi:MAG TPA: flagellar export chaperone FlgN [Planctomycetota bacterium]|nr:flagellar export chaperone FlgN [Planctomycetota bacterium]HUW34227.1 flagellar export chaperone FlgN [Planctomycetota bacterium]
MSNATERVTPQLTLAELKSIAKRLVENYGKEAELYKSVLKLTQLQHDNLEGSGDIRDFITLLHQKEDLIRAIDKIEVKLDDDKAKWVRVSDDLKNGANDHLNRILDEIILTIEKIMKVEQENEQLLKSRKDEVEQELENIRKGRKAAQEYGRKKDAKLISAIS